TRRNDMWRSYLLTSVAVLAPCLAFALPGPSIGPGGGSATPGANVQLFQGQGNYTWLLPSNTTFTFVQVRICAGGGGGGGGARTASGTASSGGAGGGGAACRTQTFRQSDVGSTQA